MSNQQSADGNNQHIRKDSEVTGSRVREVERCGMTDYISRADAIEAVLGLAQLNGRVPTDSVIFQIKAIPSAEMPKGDLISRADAVKAFKEEDLFQYCNPNDVAQEIINDIPSADAEFADLPDIPRAYYEKIVGNMSHEINMLKEQLESADAVHGELIDIDNYYRMATCSHCHKVTMFEKWGEHIKPYDFCPNCGARMTLYKGGDSE